MLNRLDNAVQALRRSLPLQRKAENWVGEAETLEALIKIYLKTRPKRAEILLEQCRAIYREPGMTWRDG